jgi:cation diffusion facilitator family transporter
MVSQGKKNEFEGRSAALRVTWLGCGANVSLAALKYGAGTLSGSSALIADAAHSLSDMLSDFVTLFVVHYARVPADEDYPYGHGRFEALGSLAVSAVLVGTAGGICWETVSTLLEYWHSGIVENSILDSGYGGLAMAACGISLVTKEMLYHATVNVGRNINSQTLIANAWHHRSDAWSSVAALAGVGGCLVGIPVLDPVSGLLVSGLVAKAGFEIAWDAAQEVTEKVQADDEVIRAVRAAAGETEGILGIHRLRSRKMGPYCLVDLHVHVHPDISVSAGHHVAERLRHRIISSEPHVSEVLVHIEPFARADFLDADIEMRPHPEVEREVRQVLAKVPEIIGVADVIVHYVPMTSSHVMTLGVSHGIHLKVDIICDEEITVREAIAIAQRAKGILQKVEGVTYVDVDLELEV